MNENNYPPLPEKLCSADGPIWRAILMWQQSPERCAHLVDRAVVDQMRTYADAIRAPLITRLVDQMRVYADEARAPLLARIADLEQKNAELLNEMVASNDARDAQRYRWLRDRNDWYAEPKVDEKEGTRWELVFYTPQRIEDPTDDDNIDAAVDAAIAQDSNVCDCQEAGVECQRKEPK